MFLRFLGRGAALNPLLGNTSAFFSEDDRLLLLDCGESVFERLVKSGALECVRHVYAAISHLHSDHCGSLGSLAFYLRYALECELTLLTPPDDEYVDQLSALLNLFGVPGDSYRFLAADRLDAFRGVTGLRFVPSPHQKGMLCWSFALDTPDGAVFYTADTCSADNITAFIRDHRDILAIYSEVTGRGYPGCVHLPLDTLADAVPPALRAKTYLMHCDDEETVQRGILLGFQAVQTEALS